jgi:DNA-3-methyladenine glycosylase I
VKSRCAWAGEHEHMIQYHDHEWGRAVHDDQVFFEFLILEGAQAGLSWDTVLRKRDRYRKVFAGFDPKKVARFDDAKQAALMKDEGIIRNRLKINSAVVNAKAFLAIQKEFGSFDRYVWGFVGGKPQVNRVRDRRDYRATSPESDALSKDLKKRGFKFVGSTIMYAFMQATGLVVDHTVDCFLAKKKA